MKYRIEQSSEGFEALVGQEDERGHVSYIDIARDNKYGMGTVEHFKTIEEAEEACQKHHIEKGYDKLPKVVKEFEL